MVDVIFIHIHKAGGHSIYKTLKSVYKKELDIPRNRKDYFLTKPSVQSLHGIIPDNKKVIYGHIEYERIKDIHEKYDSKIITWLRHPVDRVISNYFFRMKNIDEKKNSSQNSTISLDTSLLEFAEMNQNINRMSYFLKGIEAEDLFFIGTIENMDEDMHLLAKMLKWSDYKMGFHINSNSSYKNKPNCKTKVVTQEMRNRIELLNQKDMELYQKAINLRKRYEKEAKRRIFPLSLLYRS